MDYGRRFHMEYHRTVTRDHLRVSYNLSATAQPRALPIQTR